MAERIEATVKFAYGKVRPTGFVWRGREYKILRVTVVFDRRDGGKRQRCFGVETEGMIAELVWDLQDDQFSIIRVQSAL